MDKQRELIRQRVKQLRKDAGLTQTEVADEIGVSMNHYQNYEQGRVEMSFLKRSLLAKLFSISVAELSTDEEMMFKHRKD